MATTACSRCAAEVPVENLTLHELRCCGQPQQQTQCGPNSQSNDVSMMASATPSLCCPNSQSNDVSTMASATPSFSEVHTQAVEPYSGHDTQIANEGPQVFDLTTGDDEVTNSAFLEDVDLEEQPPQASAPADGVADNARAMDMWRCQRCTFENSSASIACEMCMSLRGGSSFPDDSESHPGEAFFNGSFGPRSSRQPAFNSSTQGKDCFLIFVAAFVGCLVGSVWGWCTGDSNNVVESSFFGLTMGILLGCACGQLFRRRLTQHHRDSVLPLVDPMVSGSRSRSMPLLSTEEIVAFQRLHRTNDGLPPSMDALRVPRHSRSRAMFAARMSARQRVDREQMAAQFVRQHQMLAEMDDMLESLGATVAPVNAADSRVVAALPTHKVTSDEVQFAPPEHKACTICIEDFCEGDEQRTLPCFHRFHTACVDRWLERNGACPICKHRVDEGRASV